MDNIIHEFSTDVGGQLVSFRIIHLSKSMFIWHGTEKEMGCLAVSQPTRFSSAPCASMLFGDFSQQSPCVLAQKLAKKFNMQIYVSGNVASDPFLAGLIEKEMINKLTHLLSK